MAEGPTPEHVSGRRRRSDWWLYAARGLVVALQAVVFLSFAAVMAPDEFGRFAFAFAVARMAASGISCGVPGYLLRELPARLATGRGPVPAAQLAVLSVGIPLTICLLAWVALRDLPVDFMSFREVATGGGLLVATVLILGFALSLVSTAGTLVRVGSGSFAGMAVQQALPFAAIALAFVPRLFGVRYGVPELLLVAAALLLVSTAGLILWQWRRRTGVIGAGGARLDLGRAMREAAPFWGNGLLITIATQVDIVIAAAFVHEEELGSYALIRNVANLVAIPRMIANWAIATRVARAWALGDSDALRECLADGRRLSTQPAIAGAAVLALTSPGWFYLYHVPLDAVWPWLVLALLLAANLATAFLGLSIIYASQCGLERLTLSVRIGALVIGSLVAVIGGMFLGAPGVALGTVTMTVLLNGVMSVAVRAKTRIATF
ncbi:oligosaccharide flippase family protein [Limibaculum sp. M0105]|uniref:Oligosaccharide flippase family protein n=1 Tax=Thermohalobaculum xanthum TaxID=2753746 RepID=A0A8J7M473_9RHOB|nr:oligosaccharide flippase family protein [Thermohalobaculum xanthum]MBK0397894.1 oligosaccharide flippase family protein [Thermohalobaculum xanthum]